jgi:hypothetical protein
VGTATLVEVAVRGDVVVDVVVRCRCRGSRTTSRERIVRGENDGDTSKRDVDARDDAV